MKKWMVCMAVAAMALTGCGSSDEEICEEMAESFEEFEDKAGACADSTEPGEGGNFDTAQCTEGLATCSDDDKESVKEFAECLADVPECDPDDPDEFQNAIAYCAIGNLLGVDEECGAVAVGGVE